MFTEDVISIAEKGLIKQGDIHRTDRAVEELSELILAIQHYKRSKCTREEVVKEIVDVYRRLAELTIIFSSFDEMETYLAKKLNKLKSKF